MKTFFTKHGQTISLLLVVMSLSVNIAAAQQQQWASQYVLWTFDDAVTGVYNIDQQVWIPHPNDAGFWPLQWSWLDAQGVGGYMGLQQGGDGNQEVRFSLWNATEASGSSCRPFGGEGVGYTCVLPLTIDSNKFYRLRLYRTEREDDGQWWGGWLIEADENDGLTEHFIGQIKVARAYNAVDPTSISNFVEFFGTAVRHCNEVPLSVVGFTPPSINYHGAGTGVYSGYSTYRGSNKAPGNTCVSGQEGKGAIVTAEPYNFGFESGVMMFLGGSSQEHRLDPQSHPTPPRMPDN